MIEDYYRLRGWEPDGKIMAEKLEELGLKNH
jgi:aldehyde:ferredoxin oxidoreductase